MCAVRVGIIGTGWGASVQAPAFRCLKGAELVAITSGHRERAEAVAREFGIEHAFGDYREMLRSADLDLVSIVTPPYLHHEMTLAALEAGIHVLCEKPFALDVGQAREMVDAAERVGRVAAVDHEFRFVPVRQTIARMIVAGDIGDALVVRIADFFVGRFGVSYNWWYDRTCGGGLLGATGSHYADAVRQWLGPFASVSADLRAVVPERPRADGSGRERVTADDTALVTFQLESGARGRLDQSMVVRGPRRVEIIGTAGSLLLEGGKLYHARDGDFEEVLPEARDQGRLEDPRLGPTVELAQRVVDRINGIDSGPYPTFADGLEVQRVLDAARRSSDERREVSLREIG
jgi:predicted dehydrogenase